MSEGKYISNHLLMYNKSYSLTVSVFSLPLALGVVFSVYCGVAVVSGPFLLRILLQTVLPFTIVETALMIG